jgi:hypothetical protein
MLIKNNYIHQSLLKLLTLNAKLKNVLPQNGTTVKTEGNLTDPHSAICHRACDLADKQLQKLQEFTIYPQSCHADS